MELPNDPGEPRPLFGTGNIFRCSPLTELLIALVQCCVWGAVFLLVIKHGGEFYPSRMMVCLLVVGFLLVCRSAWLRLTAFMQDHRKASAPEH